MSDNIWDKKKGSTLSDKSARKEFGLTQEEILEGINSGKLQCRVNYVYVNPYYKLIRNELEKFVEEKYGKNFLKKKKLRNELNRVNKELKKLRNELSLLEQKKNDLLKDIAE